MSVTLELEQEIYFDEDGFIVAETYGPKWFSCEPLSSNVKAFYTMTKEVIDAYVNDDGIVTNEEGLKILYNLAAELKQAVDLIHEHIDDGVYLDED
jgi:hypothetical protein